VSSEETAKNAVALAIERFGKVDILVNNAATIIYKPVIGMTVEDWEGLRAMIPNHSGSIVNVG
jgi:NAD(P)-dependent dehydrogenase (short-subunit alcohol dehydrogenase family)